ncbi:hypothetical protein J2X71_004239 [Rhizobium sp. 1399]|nr:hypothetical protein [Rhizobium sp. 1399]
MKGDVRTSSMCEENTAHRRLALPGRLQGGNPRNSTGGGANNPADCLEPEERTLCGYDAGAENWATIASLIESCTLNSVDPQAYMTSTLTTIVNGHKQRRIEELLPWNYQEK